MPIKRGPYRVPRHEVIQPLDQSYRLIPLTQGQNAIVDTSDFEWLRQFNWIAHYCAETDSFYAEREEWAGSRKARRKIKMHRLILGCIAGERGDHRSGDTLDNRRANLRKCTQGENAKNRKKRSPARSPFKGIRWHGRSHKWQVRLTVNWKRISLGYYRTPEEAARAYDKAAKEHHGEFARFNFPA